MKLFRLSGTTAVSGSDDKTIIVWETARGLALTSLQLHVQFTRFDISLECSRILVHLTDNPSFPIICLHNSPAQYIKLPTYSAPARDVEGRNTCKRYYYYFCDASFLTMINLRFKTGCSKKTSQTSFEEGTITGYILLAEKVCPFNIIGYDGAS